MSPAGWRGACISAPVVHLMHAGRGAVLLHLCISSAVTLSCTESQLSLTAPQGSKCQVSATTKQAAFPSSGGSGSIDVLTTRDCTWTIQTDASWIGLSGTRSGQGEAVIPYEVELNPTNRDRQGTLVVAESRIQIAQAAAPCRFTLNPTRQTVAASGGAVSFAVATSEGCRWRALSQDPWIHVASDAERTGSGSSALQIDGNAGAAREGLVVVEGQRFTVAQAAAGGPPAPAPNPPPNPSPTPSPGPAEPPAEPIELDGEVSGLLGICPLVTFRLADRSVTTSLETEYRDGRCRDLSDGDEVNVRGRLQASGILLADRIRFRDDKRDKGDK